MNRAAVGAVAMMLLLLCGCTPDGTQTASPAPPVKDALSSAGALRRETLEALAKRFPAVTWADRGESRVQQQPDGRCVLFLPDAVSRDDLHAASNQLKDIPAALAPVLEAHGFGPASAPEFTQGDAHVTASDPAGWKLTVTSSGTSARVELWGPVQASPCDRTALD